MRSVLLIITLCCLAATSPAAAQPFVFGSDLSYANQMEDCGAVFREDGQPKDVYQIFADNGTNLVRARLWVDPTWQAALAQPAGVKAMYSDLEDVTETFERARAAGMQLLLGFHYSDFWADPGRQVAPQRWAAIADDVDVLADSVYTYTLRVLSGLDAQGLMPDIVKLGNENNSGLMTHRSMNASFEPTGLITWDWSRHAILYNAAIQAVRDAGAQSSVNPRIALHFAGLDGLRSRYQTLIDNGVTDFDIMGFSYYYAWHGAGIRELGEQVRALRNRFPSYEAMAVETGYLWTTASADGLGNIITTPDPDYEPVSLVKQREYMVDYSREVMRAGGSGVIFWEPAWVSTACRTPWGQGSSQEHAAFFSFGSYNFQDRGAGTWPTAPYYDDLDAVKLGLIVDMTGVSTAQGVFVEGSLVDESVKMDPLGGNRYYTFLYVLPGSTGTYRFTAGSTSEAVPTACGGDGYRHVTMPSTDLELETSWAECEASGPLDVTFLVDMTGQDTSRGVYITGHVTDWQIVRMTLVSGDIYRYQTVLEPGATGAYYFMTTSTWDNYLNFRERVPAACATWYGSDRGYAVASGQVEFGAQWGTCDPVILSTAVEGSELPRGSMLHPPYPNPSSRTVSVGFDLATAQQVELALFDVLGRRVARLVDAHLPAGTGYAADVALDDLPAGVYWVVMRGDAGTQSHMLVVNR